MPLITHSIAISADRDTTPDELTHWQANPAEFVFTLADGEDFTDVDSVSLELRKMGQTGAAGLLARATASGMADVDTEVTLSFTSAEMNQTVTAEYHTLFLWLYATSTDTHTTLWKGTVKLYADETTASLTEQPPDVESWNLTEASAAALYATLTSLDALDTRVTALEDGGTEVWGGITGTLSSQTDLNTALGLKANTASLGTLATQSGTFSGSGTLATGGFTLTVPATGTAALLGTANTFTAANTINNDALGTTTAARLSLTNTTAAAAGAQQVSPAWFQRGNGWKTTATAASQTVDFQAYVLPVQGTANPSGTWKLQSSINGAAMADVLTVTSAGAVDAIGSMQSPTYYGAGGLNGLLRMDGNTSARGLGIGSACIIAWASGTHSGGSVSGTTMLGRQADANLRQGAADAAAPVAQTSSVQSVVAGTVNTAGADRTYSASQSTGSGIGGSHVFSTSPTTGGGATAVNALVEAFRITGSGGIQVPTTVTAGGTTGNRTIDKTSGTVNIAAAGTTVTVTNRLCSANSIVMAVIRTNDTTAVLKNVVPGAGSFVINLNAACTAETSIGFIVFNP